MTYYKDHRAVSSDLVYPLDKGYSYELPLDKEWVEKRLFIQYGVKELLNKYAVEIRVPATDSMILVVNHDGEYWKLIKSL